MQSFSYKAKAELCRAAVATGAVTGPLALRW